MKEQTKKEREIYVIGRPSLEHLSPNERKAFFSTLLMCVIEHFSKKNKDTPDKVDQFLICLQKRQIKVEKNAIIYSQYFCERVQ